MLILFPILFASLKAATAFNGFTTSGTHFVFAPVILGGPSFKRETSGIVYITTENWNVTVTIKGNNLSARKESLVVSRDSPKKHKIRLRWYNDASKSGIYNLLILLSSSPVHAVLEDVAGGGNDNYGAIKLFPKQSCHRTHYAVTAFLQPFIMVHAFDKDTNLKIKFPSYQTKFSVSCSASKICTPNSEVSVTLAAYKVWRFVVGAQGKGSRVRYDLHNTRIVSNQPVFVVSGNLICEIDAITVRDACMTSVTPVEAWGTQYAVPIMFYREKKQKAQPIYFRTSATSFPLHYSYFADGNETKRKSETHTSVFRIELVYPTPIFFTSNVPFGLYMFYLYTTQVFELDITRLVPVEQWTHGLLYVPSEFDGTRDDHLYILLTTTDPAKLTISTVAKDVLWDKKVGRLNGISYWSGSFDLRRGVTKIFSKVSPAKCMLYIRRIKTIWGFLTYSYDSYQGIINSDNCVPTTPLAGDGVDNDCDGFVDEETENNLDDDNDKKVDEDNEEPYRDGQWGPWAGICNKKCPNTDSSQPMRVRTCSSVYPSKFGRRCAGNSEACGQGNTLCPQVCPDRNVKPIVKCTCQEGCAECRKDSPNCTKCKPGYVDSLFCLNPCPVGWKGTGCAEGPRTLSDFKALEPTKGTLSSNSTTIMIFSTTTTSQPETVDELFPYVMMVMPILLMVVLVSLCCLITVYSRRRKRRIGEGQDEEETAQTQENDVSSKESVGEEERAAQLGESTTRLEESTATIEESSGPVEESTAYLEDSIASPEALSKTEKDQTEAESEKITSENENKF